MDGEIRINNMSVAADVVATIISMAAAEVDGVAGVGPSGSISSSIRSVLAGKAALPATSGVTAQVTEDGKLHVGVSLQVEYGRKLTDVAASVRSAVAAAVSSQVGVDVEAVDVNVDGIAFAGGKATA